jgi:hypothetical protein
MMTTGEEDLVVLRWGPGVDVPSHIYDRLDGLWIDRSQVSTLPGGSVEVRAGVSWVAMFTNEFEVRDDGAVAQVMRIKEQL